MAASGAVFFPASGDRHVSDLYYLGGIGIYWSSTADDSTKAYALFFDGTRLNPQSNHDRYWGFAVRLVSRL